MKEVLKISGVSLAQSGAARHQHPGPGGYETGDRGNHTGAGHGVSGRIGAACKAASGGLPAQFAAFRVVQAELVLRAQHGFPPAWVDAAARPDREIVGMESSPVISGL